MIRTIIVDDEPTTESVVRYFVTHEGLPLEIVSTANNGKVAVSEIKRLNPNLVLLDIQMPVMDGFEVMAAASDTNYIIITAYDTFDYAQKALRLGAADILLKPIEITQLRQAISRAVGWRFTGNVTVDEIIGYIHKCYAEKISLAGIAQEFYLSQSHVARMFKQYTGESVVAYINKVRIDNAKRMLLEGASVKDVARCVGYDSLNNFYKYFKRVTGITPALYSKNINL